MLKRLIEVALPLKEVSEQLARKKSIRHGHIFTLHIWWARRPLAAYRAAVFASLIPDPEDPECPDSFRTLAGQHWIVRLGSRYPRGCARGMGIGGLFVKEGVPFVQNLAHHGGVREVAYDHLAQLRENFRPIVFVGEESLR